MFEDWLEKYAGRNSSSSSTLVSSSSSMIGMFWNSHHYSVNKSWIFSADSAFDLQCNESVFTYITKHAFINQLLTQSCKHFTMTTVNEATEGVSLINYQLLTAMKTDGPDCSSVTIL